MNQLRKLVSSLSIRQRITIVVAVALVTAGIYSFTHWTKERNFKPLYAALSAEDSGAVIAKLKEGGIEYRFSDSNSAILVPAEKIAELRLQMASAGIPKSGRIGYELFDKTNFGTTDFEEQVNYHRAIEGELERSVMAIASVEQARVHITFPKESIFVESRQPAKASVMVKLKLGSKLSTQNATAVQQLVASAVETLTAESVSVMDMQGNLLLRPKKPGDGTEPSDELLSYKDKLEHETASKITSVLDPLLGLDKYRASVDLDVDQTSGEQSEETFDPTKSVLTTSQRTEEGSGSRDAGGVPGTASNLPRPSSTPTVRGGNLARRTESMNYQTSRMVRKTRMPQGIIRRMSISVLVDQNVRWDLVGKGASAHYQRVIEPPSPERMKIIRDVVVTAAGFNTQRGDQVTVETLPFQATLMAEAPALPGAKKAPAAAPAKNMLLQPAVLAGAGAGVLLLGAAGFFIWRSRRKTKAKMAEISKQLAAAQAAQNEEQIADSVQLQSLSESVERAELPQRDPITGEEYRLPPMLTTKTEILTKQVLEEAAKDPVAVAQIVRSWLNEKSTD